MICFICPVATAGAVITKKLGGNASHITTYTILINIVAAIIIPAVIPFVHLSRRCRSGTPSILILGKVFPLLLLPLFMAFLVRWLSPRLHFILTHYHELAFYLWVVALALATAVTTRFIVHSQVSLSVELWLVAVTFINCVVQFSVGWKIGRIYGDRRDGRTIPRSEEYGAGHLARLYLLYADYLRRPAAFTASSTTSSTPTSCTSITRKRRRNRPERAIYLR